MGELNFPTNRPKLPIEEEEKKELVEVNNDTKQTALNTILDPNISQEDMKESIKKATIVSASSSEEFIGKATKTQTKILLEEIEADRDKSRIGSETDILSLKSLKAKEYYTNHKAVFEMIGMKEPHGIDMMDTLYKIMFVPFIILKIIQSFGMAIKEIFKLIFDVLGFIFSSFLDFVTIVVNSGTKATKAVGWMVIVLIVFCVFILFVYLGLSMIGINIFEVIKTIINNT